ncbi:MAG: DnaJ domain-containing protein, partial [Pyrinomonadaceae bacterium]|nr:DnaJ domain-containing protein [Pyrinomonadaceae bacterium]
LTSDEVQVMGCLSDDPATAASIIDRSGLSEVAAIKALYALWLTGRVRRSNWNPAFSDMKISAMLGAVLELKQEAKTYFSPALYEKAVENTSHAEPTIESPEAPVLTLEEYLDRVEKAETHYDILGVDPKAETAVLKRSYFTLAKNFHPDHFHKDGGELLKRVQDAFTQLTQAHEALKTPETRETYDFKIRKELADRQKAKESGTYDERSTQFQQAAASFERGYSLLLDDEPEASLQFFARAVHFDPNNARYHAYYGQALSHDPKHRHKAEGEMQAAVKIDPNNTKFRLMLAEFFIAMKLMKRAEGELNRLLAIFPSNREARELLASLRS